MSARRRAMSLCARNAAACLVALSAACTPDSWSERLQESLDAASSESASAPDASAGTAAPGRATTPGESCPGGPDCLAPVDCAASGACRPCADSSECPAPTPACVRGACTACIKSTDCARFRETPVCHPASGSCVQCSAAESFVCVQSSQVCSEGGTRCVPCNTHSDCAVPGLARCEAHVCVPCRGDDDCAHVAGAASCNEGACVECTPTTEALRCGERACDPDTLRCTQSRRGSVRTCERCRSDSECISPGKCVQARFMEQDDGFHCMTPAGIGECVLPFGGSTLNRRSKNSAKFADYCAQSVETSCEATNAYLDKKGCSPSTVESDCGRSARCELLGGVHRCTYACSSGVSCTTDTPCNWSSSDDAYCGGPTP